MTAAGQVQILYPVAAMVLQVMIVMALMLRERVREMMTRRIHPQKFPSSTQLAAALENTRGADNFKNLFEAPVLFYVLCLALLATQTSSTLFVALAWLYVALRYAHSFIHLGYNKVMHRFKVYLASTVLLAVMWVLLVVQLIAQTG